MHPKYRFRGLVTVACLAAMLSGCSGGSQTLTIPEGLVRSTATPVYATNADSFESAGVETQYPALSSLLEKKLERVDRDAGQRRRPHQVHRK